MYFMDIDYVISAIYRNSKFLWDYALKKVLPKSKKITNDLGFLYII